MGSKPRCETCHSAIWAAAEDVRFQFVKLDSDGGLVTIGEIAKVIGKYFQCKHEAKEADNTTRTPSHPPASDASNPESQP